MIASNACSQSFAGEALETLTMSAPSRGGFLVVVSVALASDDIGEDDDADDDDGDFSPSNKVAISIPKYGRAMICLLRGPPRLDGRC